ncbi:Lsr2 family DNA-binding protein [Streptomyces griseosporeus]|uniref:Lsr2 family DNA-binding protein n=1 Tax=Streptomyces griseosporeus TaxID=1910 RepID=UPI0036A199DD
MTIIDRLTRLCPPPAAPPAVDWDTAEAALGFRLPEDYKELCAVYSPGAFAGFIRVFRPGGVTEWVDLTGPVPGDTQERLRGDRERGRPVPHDPGSLFTVGVTDNGDHIYWVTEPREDPDAWHIAVEEGRGPGWFTFSGTLSEFLLSVLSGETVVPLFPEGLRSQAAVFVPSVPGPTGRPAAPPALPRDTNVIREWARANGYDVPARGRVPAAVIDAWVEAHSGT